MSETNQAQFKPVTANGVEFFCQVRGRGPALLMIPSICGDSGPFDGVAEKLADRYQVITYDLRGHSRSGLPEGWHKTSMAEQADDAAALLKQLKVKSATVFGTGVGALIALEMMQPQRIWINKEAPCGAPACNPSSQTFHPQLRERRISGH